MAARAGRTTAWAGTRADPPASRNTVDRAGTVPRLAAHVGLSRSKLSEHFTDLVGEPPRATPPLAHAPRPTPPTRGQHDRRRRRRAGGIPDRARIQPRLHPLGRDHTRRLQTRRHPTHPAGDIPAPPHRPRAALSGSDPAERT